MENPMSQNLENQLPDAAAPASRKRLLSVLGGAAALLVAALFITALIPLIGSDTRTETSAQDNFLTLIFKLHAGISGNHMESLSGLNTLDVVILILVGMMSQAVFPIIRQVNKTWALIAVCLPFVGLGMYVLTHDVGRSGILGSGLVFAALMLRSETFRKTTAYTGILAGICLLIGDVGTAFSYSMHLGIFVGLGYILYMLWCGLIGWELIQFGWDTIR
jgi:hypothetical protein